ncbi:T9SS C-terminal target domain-containing protein [Aquimarina sp. BL5]|nr:T9SS C-terminal target domain-containing protein [Aquimarina sp. BL5]
MKTKKILKPKKMKNKINYSLQLNFTILCILTILLSAFKGSSQNRINVSLDYNQSTRLQKKVYGYNDENLNKPYYSTNNTFKSVYNDLGKPTVRYPAGTGSNYLNIKTGFANNYVRGRMTPEDFQKHVIETNEGLRRNGKGENGQDWREFAKFVKSENPEVTYIINLSTMTLNENREVLQGIKNIGATINHFEIGNEVFFGSYETPFPSGTFYLRKAREASEMIKSIFPEAKVAVVLPAKFYTKESFLDGPAPIGNRLENWYEDVLSQDWYDALAVHLYAETGMESNVNPANYIPYETSYTYGISHNDNRLQSTFNRLKRDFPTKKIWLTEYHTGGFGGNLRQYKMRLSYLGGLFNANFMMKLFSNPQIELSSWHSFQQWLTFRSRRGELMPDNFEYEELVNYSFFKMFKDPVKNSTKFIKTEIENSKKYDGLGRFEGRYDEIDAGTFYNPNTKEGYTIIFNKKESAYTLSKSSFENNLDGEILEFKEITPDKNQNLLRAINDTSEDARLKKSISNINPNRGLYRLRPYSMYVVHYKREQNTNQSPELTILNPRNLETIIDPVSNVSLETGTIIEGNDIVINVAANDPDGIKEVRLYLNGELIRTDTEAPYGWGGASELQNVTGGSYRIKVVAIDNNGQRTKKIIILTVLPQSLRGVRFEKENTSAIMITPNPVSKGSSITIHQKGNLYLKLYDLTGKEIMKLDIDSNELDLDISKLSSGIYILKSDTATSKFIIQ